MRATGEHFRFYVYHSLRSLWREKQRSAFAVFCVIAGVASIVGLQTLGLLVADTLTGNAQASNRGDVALVRGGDDFFSTEQTAAFEGLVTEGLATGITYRYRSQELRVAAVRDQGAGQGLILDSFLVDASVYPFYGQIRALDPPDAPLAGLLKDPHDVVIGKSLADRYAVAIGDQLQIGESGDRYVVRGVVPSASSVPGENVAPLLLGFVYLDYEAALRQLGLERTATEVFFTTKNPQQASILAARLSEIIPDAQPRTAAELLEQAEETSLVVGRLVLVVGLLALLIGGLGIANTMLVAVARRTPEIAVLKSLGLKGRQVTLLFLIEAAMLGLLGAFVGLPVGLAMSRGLLELAAFFFPNPTIWRPYALPLVTGLVVGVLVTTVCGFLPALAAAQTRPLQVLQPNGLVRPRTGRWRSLAAILGLTAVVGTFAGQLLHNLAVGLVGAYVTLALMTILIGLLWTVVWVIEKMPCPRWVPSLRLALRGIGRNRGRAASTLLALIVGLFGIGLVTMFTTGVLEALEDLTSGTVGADLILLAPTEDAAHTSVLRALDSHPDIISYAAAGGFPAELVAINGEADAYERRISAYERERGEPLTLEQRQSLDGYFGGLSGREVPANLPRLDFAPGMGRNLTHKDAFRPVALLSGTPSLAPLHLAPGETLTFRLANGTEITLEIVGISEETMVSVSLGGSIFVPYNVLAPLVEPETPFILVDVDSTHQDAIVTTLIRQLPAEAVVLETDVLIGLFAEFARQITILPLLIAGLALFAAATMVANTTALVTMERRREIGVMRAVGVKTRQVLGQLLLESAILGFVGGLLGLGLVVLVLALFSSALTEFSAEFSVRAILPLLALALSVTLLATLFSAFPASRQRPLNVLRYE